MHCCACRPFVIWSRYDSSSMGMEVGGNGNNQWEWEENENKTRLNLLSGMGMGRNHWEWEEMGRHSRSSLLWNILICAEQVLVIRSGRHCNKRIKHYIINIVMRPQLQGSISKHNIGSVFWITTYKLMTFVGSERAGGECVGRWTSISVGNLVYSTPTVSPALPLHIQTAMTEITWNYKL